MSYLEEWNRIEQMIESNNISKSTTVTSEKVQSLASMHIAKCLSVYADEVANAQNNVESIRKCGECVHQGDTEHCASCQIIFKVTGFEKKIEETTDKICCETCLHSDESALQDPCISCDGYYGYLEPKKATDEKDEIKVECPVCGRVITIINTSYNLLYLLCPTCSTKFTYDFNTHVKELYID